MGESSRHGDRGSRGAAAAAHGLDPSSPLTVGDAAELAGVPVGAIESQLEDGSLLFETGPSGGSDARIIRLMDLAESYPSLRPREEPHGSAGSSGQEPASAVVETDRDDRDIASVVRASGADRNALIDLCQDLETRLDLAERERQASTASLLMAQRRVLDLERRDERRPIAWMAAATLGVLGIALSVLAFRLPSTVRAAAREELEQVQSTFEERTARMRESLDASMASLAGSMAQAMESARLEERELLAAEREAQAGQIAALEARLAEARALQASEAESRTSELAKQLSNDAAERLAQDAVERREQNESLEVRLRAAEALGRSATEALAQDRTLSEAERAAFKQQLEDALARHDQALKATLDRLESTAGPVAPADSTAAGGAGPDDKEKAPVPWWKRALGGV